MTSQTAFYVRISALTTLGGLLVWIVQTDHGYTINVPQTCPEPITISLLPTLIARFPDFRIHKHQGMNADTPHPPDAKHPLGAMLPKAE